MNDTPQIYIACLASYNNGEHHGEWMDADDEDMIQENIAKILRTSRYPNVSVDCPEPCEDGKIDAKTCKTCKGTSMVRSAEEFGIFDTSGLCGLVGEWTPISDVVEVAEAVEKYGAVFSIACEYWSNLEDATSAMENYRGEYSNAGDYAQEFYEECYHEAMEAMPDALRYAIDWESVANGLDITEIRAGGNVHIFQDW
jgi:antirestriction protein